MVLPQGDRGDWVLTFGAFKRRVFILEGLNGFAASIYFNYLFFFLKEHFGFGNSGNLVVGALNGLVYTFGAYYGGQLAQKKGGLQALEIGWALVAGALLLAAASSTVAFHLTAMCVWTIGISFTWPALEALSCEGENAETLPRKVGIYNVVWSLTLAGAYFVGGAVIETFGWTAMFLLPALIHLGQAAMARSLRNRTSVKWEEMPGAPPPLPKCEVTREAKASTNRRFLRMAWLANPFAYIAMNTVVPLIPDVAARLQLTPMAAGFFCSIWMFARTACFLLLWKWTAWHYRFRWLACAYVLLIVSFAALLLSANLWLLAAVQLAFGWAVGLIYYSSLFYSMDASDTKSAHGGIHEAAIGAGIFAGPAIGGMAIYLWPGVAHSSVWAVSAVLTMGLGGLFFLRKR